jgi:parallel beta-helix repeat protein
MRHSILPLLLWSILPYAAFAATHTYHVPDDYPTIQQAIDASMNGYTIIVRAGTYRENLDFDGKAVHLRSEDGPKHTVIDGDRVMSVVRFLSGEGPDSILEGFTITNGSGIFYKAGGGINCNGASPTIRNNIITKNLLEADKSYGGGIDCYKSDALIEYNIISDNAAQGYSEARGGGIYCDAGSPTIQFNLITNNSVYSDPRGTSKGGGIYCGGNGDALIIGNLLLENHTPGDLAGELGCMNAAPLILNNYIKAAHEPQPCGGIEVRDGSAPEIRSNIITGCGLSGIHTTSSTVLIEDNIISDNAEEGIRSTSSHALAILNNEIRGNQRCGIYCWWGSSLSIMNNTICHNASPEDGGGIYLNSVNNGLIINNMIHGNTCEEDGAGIVSVATTMAVMNNTVTGNAAKRKGGGMAFKGDGYFQMIGNSIFWDNQAQTGPEIHLGGHTILRTGYSIVQGGQAGIHVGDGAVLDWGPGMIQSDPRFADPVGEDFHIPYTSPCRNAGTTSAMDLPDEDFEGDPRNIDEGVDIGADEFHTHFYCTGDATPGGLIEAKIIGIPGTQPLGIWLGSGLIDPPLPAMGGLWHLEPPWILFGPLGTMPPSGIMTIPASIPASPSAPFDLYAQATVGDALSNLFILEVR